MDEIPVPASEEELLQFLVSATDCDSETLTFSATNLPFNASFNPETREFSWTPDASQAGLHYVVFHVSDGTATDSQEVAILVEDTMLDSDLDGVADFVGGGRPGGPGQLPVQAQPRPVGCRSGTGPATPATTTSSTR